REVGQGDPCRQYPGGVTETRPGPNTACCVGQYKGRSGAWPSGLWDELPGVSRFHSSSMDITANREEGSARLAHGSPIAARCDGDRSSGLARSLIAGTQF